jgi:hypothetical protein
MFWEGFFFWLANFSAIVGLITSGITGIAWWRLRAERRKVKERLDTLAHQTKGAPVAIAVGVGPKVGDISGMVKKYLDSQGLQMQIFSIFRTEEIAENEAYSVLDEVLTLRRQLNAAGPTRIHFFYGGPVALAASLGAALDNWVPTLLYIRDDVTIYKPLMELGKFGRPQLPGK